MTPIYATLKGLATPNLYRAQMLARFEASQVSLPMPLVLKPMMPPSEGGAPAEVGL